MKTGTAVSLTAIAVIVGLVSACTAAQVPAPTVTLAVDVPTPVPSATETLAPTATLAPTNTPAPSATPMRWPTAEPVWTLPAVARGQSCDPVERLDGASSEAIRIATAYAEAYHARFPTEYRDWAYLIDVSRLEGYVAIRAQVVDPVGVWVGREEGDAVIPLAEIFFPGGPVWSRYGIAEYFIDALPDGPALLFNCIDPNGILWAVPPEDQDPLDIVDPDPDCARVAQVPPTDPDVQTMQEQMLVAGQVGRGGSFEFDQIVGGWRLDDWLVVRSDYTEPFRGEPRPVYGLFVIRPRVRMIRHVVFSPFPSRSLVARHLYSHVPDFPRELLSCIPIETVPVTLDEYTWLDQGLKPPGP